MIGVFGIPIRVFFSSVLGSRFMSTVTDAEEMFAL